MNHHQMTQTVNTFLSLYVDEGLNPNGEMATQTLEGAKTRSLYTVPFFRLTKDLESNCIVAFQKDILTLIYFWMKSFYKSRLLKEIS